MAVPRLYGPACKLIVEKDKSGYTNTSRPEGRQICPGHKDQRYLAQRTSDQRGAVGDRRRSGSGCGYWIPGFLEYAAERGGAGTWKSAGHLHCTAGVARCTCGVGNLRNRDGSRKGGESAVQGGCGQVRVADRGVEG